MGDRKTNDELIQEIKGYWNNIQNLTNNMYTRPNKLSTEELMEEFEYPQSKPPEQKSRVGYFAGAPDLTIGTRGDSSNPLIPLVVPTLSREEIDSLAAGNKPDDQTIYRAKQYAKDRIEQGLSPFAGVDEMRALPDKIVKENSMRLDTFLKKLAEPTKGETMRDMILRQKDEKKSIPTGAMEKELPDAKGEKKEVDINATKVVKSALDSFLKRAAEFLPEGVDAKQLEMGREVEKEHKKTYDQIVDFYNKNNSLPSFEQVAEWIALDHLNEPGNEEYYTKLQTIEKKAGVADFLKRLGTKTKPEPKPEGLLKLIDDIKPKEDPMQQLLQHEISKGGSIR